MVASSLGSVKAWTNRHVAGIAVLAILAGFCPRARAFDLPDFSVELYSRDGIFLANDERSSLLEALAALASNFAGSALVDDDLREKALTLALGLDPLHYHSRQAIRALARGTMPDHTPFFDNLPALSETLWSTGTRLAQPPVDPEEKRLAKYLLELALVTHPDPPAERLTAFGRVCGSEAPDWKNAITLHRDSNPSTARASSLFRRAMGKVESEQREMVGAPIQPQLRPETKSPEPTLPRPDFAPVSRSLNVVRWANFESGVPLAGTVSLTLRLPDSGTESRWLVEKLTQHQLLPFLSSDLDLPVTGLEIPAGMAKEKGWNWPEGVLGEVRFIPERPIDGQRRLHDSSATLPAIVLAESVLSNKTINPDFVLLGDIDPISGVARFDGRIIPQIEAAPATGGKYLLVPDGAVAALISHVKSSGALDLLFTHELIAYANAGDAAARLLNPTGTDLSSASAIFAEIEGAKQRMPLPELARNPSAQDRLRSLLAACPQHLSARVMLDYGGTPMSETETIAAFGAKVHAIIAPLLVLEDSTRTDGDAGTGIGTGFLKLRGECPPAAKNLLDSAEDVQEAAALYLQFTNTETSLAAQRLRETRDAIDKYRAARTSLGLGNSE